MDEYIKREDVMKAIQTVRDVMADSMIRHRHVPDCVKSLCEEVIDATERVINRIPAADVVEVVRCGECVYRTSGKPSCQGRHKDWFCANGVRRRMIWLNKKENC